MLTPDNAPPGTCIRCVDKLREDLDEYGFDDKGKHVYTPVGTLAWVKLWEYGEDGEVDTVCVVLVTGEEVYGLLLSVWEPVDGYT